MISSTMNVFLSTWQNRKRKSAPLGAFSNWLPITIPRFNPNSCSKLSSSPNYNPFTHSINNIFSSYNTPGRFSANWERSNNNETGMAPDSWSLWVSGLRVQLGNAVSHLRHFASPRWQARKVLSWPPISQSFLPGIKVHQPDLQRRSVQKRLVWRNAEWDLFWW